MRNDERLRIEQLKQNGYGYKRIAAELNLSPNTVKAYLRRKKVSENGVKVCKNCGASVHQLAHRKEKLFCSDACRMAWWNKHQSQVKRKAFYHLTCAYCGNSFVSYGNKNRVYCSRSCYALARRKEGGTNE